MIKTIIVACKKGIKVKGIPPPYYIALALVLLPMAELACTLISNVVTLSFFDNFYY